MTAGVLQILWGCVCKFEMLPPDGFYLPQYTTFPSNKGNWWLQIWSQNHRIFWVGGVPQGSWSPTLKRMALYRDWIHHTLMLLAPCSIQLSSHWNMRIKPTMDGKTYPIYSFNISEQQMEFKLISGLVGVWVFWKFILSTCWKLSKSKK